MSPDRVSSTDARRNRRLLRVAAGLLAVVILLIDILAPLEGAVAVLYVVVVLIAARTGRRADILAAAAVGIGFTVAAYLVSHGVAHVGSPSLRALVSLAAIAITAVLSLHNRATTERLAATARLIDIAHDMIFMRDQAGVITFWNRAAEQTYGWPASEAVGQVADTLLRTRYPISRAAIEAVLAETGRWDGTLTQRTRAGAELVLDSRWALRADRLGQPLGVLETHTNVTDRQAAHAALVQSERRYRRMFDASRVGIVEEEWSQVRAELGRLGISDEAALGRLLGADPSFLGRARKCATIVRINPAFGSMIGFPDGTPEITVDDILGEDDTSFAAVLAAFVRGDRFLEGETEIARCDTGRVPVMFGINFPSLEDADSDVFVFVVDLTERRQAEDALLAAQTELAHAMRVATLGELSASIAHEVNQPLMAVVTNGEAALRWLRRPEPDLGEVEAGLARIVAEGRRASEIVAQIRAFLRKSAPAREPLAVDDLVEDAVRLVAHELVRAEIRVAVAIEPGLPSVPGDRVGLQQVLVNLLVNAVQAMRDSAGFRRLTIVAGRSGDGVEITVADTGPGIPAAEIDRLFAPFFTTKATGMGMGLAICRSTVEAHGGRLTVESAPGAGATFRLVLPQIGEDRTA